MLVYKDRCFCLRECKIKKCGRSLNGEPWGESFLPVSVRDYWGMFECCPKQEPKKRWKTKEEVQHE